MRQVHAQDGESGSEDGGDNDSKSTVERKYLHDPDILDDPEMIQVFSIPLTEMVVVIVLCICRESIDMS